VLAPGGSSSLTAPYFTQPSGGFGGILRAGLSGAALGYLRVLEDEPGFLARAFAALVGLFRRKKAVSERNLVLDEHGNVVDLDDPGWGRG